MQTPDFESIAARLRNLDDQIVAAEAALQDLLSRRPTHTLVAITDDEDGAHSVPAHYIIFSLRQWQHDARAAKIEAIKQLEGLG